jgi:hypothetical protein
MTQPIGNRELKKYHLARNDILISTNSGFEIELAKNSSFWRL